MTEQMIVNFIEEEIEKVKSNFYRRVYSIDKAIGHLAALGNLAGKINRDDLIIKTSDVIRGLRS
jgi:hypothetical protein